jgi:hypothetical protein
LEVSFLDKLKAATSEEELTKLGFVFTGIVMGFSESTRKKISEWGKSERPEDREECVDLLNEYELEAFHPKSQLPSKISQDGKDIIVPSIRYRRFPDGKLSFREVGALVMPFGTNQIVNPLSGEIKRMFVGWCETRTDCAEASSMLDLLNKISG